MMIIEYLFHIALPEFAVNVAIYMWEGVAQDRHGFCQKGILVGMGKHYSVYILNKIL